MNRTYLWLEIRIILIFEEEREGEEDREEDTGEREREILCFDVNAGCTSLCTLLKDIKL